MIHNTYTIISNYCTNALQDTLNEYGEHGYKLVNTMMVKNKCGIEEMYLFFTKEVEQEIENKYEYSAPNIRVEKHGKLY